MFFGREIERWCVKQDDGRFPSARCLFTTRFPQRLLGLFVAGLTALAVHAGPTDVPSTLVGFNIPAGAAEHGLRLFARQAGVEVLFEVEQVKGRQANAVEGRFTPRSALEALVAGTGLVILHDEETGAMAVKTGHPTVDPDKALPKQPNTETARKTKTWNTLRNILAALFLSTGAADMAAQTQSTQANTPITPPQPEQVVVLSPFVVNSEKDTGYQATSTLAGSRLNTSLKDLGASISIYTKDYLDDLGATSSTDLLIYATGMEAGGSGGNFSGESSAGTATVIGPESRTNPQTSSRTRGLAAPSFTRGFFVSDIGFDTYNTERVTVNRGPNAILFGVGSAAGVVESTLLAPSAGHTVGSPVGRTLHRRPRRS